MTRKGIVFIIFLITQWGKKIFGEISCLSFSPLPRKREQNFWKLILPLFAFHFFPFIFHLILRVRGRSWGLAHNKTTTTPPPLSMGTTFVGSGEIQLWVTLPLLAFLPMKSLLPRDPQKRISWKHFIEESFYENIKLRKLGRTTRLFMSFHMSRKIPKILNLSVS